MIRYAPGLWDYHPGANLPFWSLEEAEAAATLVPSSLETRIYRRTQGRLYRVS